jgi:hypothetical protein
MNNPSILYSIIAQLRYRSETRGVIISQDCEAGEVILLSNVISQIKWKSWV